MVKNSFALVNPNLEIKLEKNNQVKVVATNELENEMNCDWAISYFENGLNYKRNFGTLKIASRKQAVVSIPNDPFAKIKSIRTQFECE